MSNRIQVVPFIRQYRESVRRLAFDTAFRGESAEAFFTDREVLADILTRYYTDYEPQSCLVALWDNDFAGYLLGTTDCRSCATVFLQKIMPRLTVSVIRRGTLFKPRNLNFLFKLTVSLFKGELRSPDFTRDYPSTLHLNLNHRFRGLGIGSLLLEAYFSYLRANNIKAVHLATFSPQAAVFFRKNGFRLLYQSRRSYFRDILGEDIGCDIYGKVLT